MTNEMSFWVLIVGATVPVKLVLLILFGASALSWVMIIQRGLYLRGSGADLKRFASTFWSGGDLNQLFHDGTHRFQGT